MRDEAYTETGIPRSLAPSFQEYDFLVPFMLAIVALEQALRIGVGVLKPLQVASPPPGAVGSYLLLPLSLVALALALRRGQDDEADFSGRLGEPVRA